MASETGEDAQLIPQADGACQTERNVTEIPFGEDNQESSDGLTVLSPLSPQFLSCSKANNKQSRRFQAAAFVIVVLSVSFLAVWMTLRIYGVNGMREKAGELQVGWNNLHGADGQEHQQQQTMSKRCGGLSIRDVWTVTLPKLLTESAVRMLDVNADGIADVILGFATGGDGYLVPDVVCDIYFNGIHPCFGGILALDGATGRELWRTYAKHEVFALNCNADLNRDGQKDCLAGGRAAIFLAIDTRTGTPLWTVKVSDTDLSNFYTPQIIRDLNNDGVPEVLVSHGGDPLREPGKQVKIIGVLMILDGFNGHTLKSMPVPDGGETYYSPQVYSPIEGTDNVLFGTGGETHGGSLWVINLSDMLHGNGSEAVAILTDPFKGVMVPPVLADITDDGVVDIIMAMYNSSVIALDGRTFQEIWRYTTLGAETYSTPAAGYYNDDDVPDFFVNYSVGPGYPIYYYAESMVLDGRTGRPLWDEPMRNIIGSQSSPLSISVAGGGDYFLYWLSDCGDSELKLPRDDDDDNLRYKFAKGTRVHQQSRADFCKLRFKSSGVNRFYALRDGDPLPGWKIYDSNQRKDLERKGWINTTLLAERYLKSHPDAGRIKRHVGPHDGEGIQRLISTGSLADSFGTASDGAIDVVFATYWFYPAKTVVVLAEDQACIDGRMRKEEERFEMGNRYYGMDHDAFENTVEAECLSRRAGNHNNSSQTGETFRDLFHLEMGSMTVYRMRLRCSGGLQFSPMAKQHWAAYMGTHGTSLFYPPSPEVMANSNPANMTMDDLMTSFSEPPQENALRYFGVQMAGKTEENPIVLKKLPNPKTFLAICPTVRFKEFSTREEALAFSQFDVPIVTDQSFKRAAEPRSPFPSPSVAERDLLLSSIAAGDCATLRGLAWKNPRLLVTPDEAPQCYRGTWRQTALHLAVQASSFPVFCTLMEVIDSRAFAVATQLTEFEDLEVRRKMMVGNYLNNRNRKEESALDCAIVFGMVEIVDFLTVHPLCDLKTGKSLQQWQSTVCTRCDADRKAHCPTIMSMLEGRWYLPVYPSPASFGKSIVGEPVPVNTMRQALRDGKLTGFIGPATREQCEKLSCDIKTLHAEKGRRSRTRSRTASDVADGKWEDVDAEMNRAGVRRGGVGGRSLSPKVGLKGTEAVARALAKRNGLGWKEWWSFLGKFLDIASARGLVELEGYLANRAGNNWDIESAGETVDLLCINDDLTVVEILSLHYTRHSSTHISSPAVTFTPVTQTSTAESQFDLDDEDSLDIFYTPPSSPEPIHTALFNFSERYAKRPSLFVGGRKPSLSDCDLYDALMDVPIPDDFRYILAWRDQMARNLQAADLTDAMSFLFL
ncbi:hypothetical protein BV898_07118 [Hypsibius exemplaris]|uniref:FAM234A/B beta-propeller domain-containing protein n=1 Tax=Hypsibius exemplaris TaxID=2072580 RepID=A0A1W0WUJ0_HYPEX|nr:hypothetical protein BV898_07118 [Hypsibius exemplaris]